MRPLVRAEASAALRRLLRETPVVALLGPRQSGKTTLARTALPHAPYWDLERPSDAGRLEAAGEEILREERAPAILDEAQRAPALFPLLRSLVDEKRRNGRFLLLGSASPELVRGLSESLAGRIAAFELTPLSWREIPGGRRGLARIWGRGGFPPALLAPNDRAWWTWTENYLRNLIERDLGLLGFELPSPRLLRFAGILAHLHGGLWNAAEAGRSLAVSYHTAQRYAEILSSAFLVRFLPPWHANLGKRLVKQPKVYWRDTGLLHHLLGLERPSEILRHPKAGASWEGFVLEEILRRERAAHPATKAHFFRTHTGLECDLLLARGRRIIPVEMKLGHPGRDDIERLAQVMRLLGADRGHIVAQIPRSSRAGKIHIWSAADLLLGRSWRLN